jgi:hypothetical protein
LGTGFVNIPDTRGVALGVLASLTTRSVLVVTYCRLRTGGSEVLFHQILNTVPQEHLKPTARMSGRVWYKVKRGRQQMSWDKMGTAPLWTRTDIYSNLWAVMAGQAEAPHVRGTAVTSRTGSFLEEFHVDTEDEKSKLLIVGDAQSVLAARDVDVVICEVAPASVVHVDAKDVMCRYNKAHIILRGHEEDVARATEDLLRTFPALLEWHVARVRLDAPVGWDITSLPPPLTFSGSLDACACVAGSLPWSRRISLEITSVGEPALQETSPQPPLPPSPPP